MKSLFHGRRRRGFDLDPERRELVYVTLGLFAWLGLGAFGYAIIEGWTIFDGFYMAFITLTTIGFSEINELSTAGRLFTVLIAFVGIGSVAFVASRLVRVLLMGQLLRRRRLARKIKQMRGHYIICGYGRIGKRMVDDLTKQERDLVVLERNVELVNKMVERGIPALLGDASDEEALRDAGIAEAKGLITVLPVDADNIFVTLVARKLNEDLFILARTTYNKNRQMLRHAGANQVVAPSEVGADRMAQVILRPHVDRFMSQVMQVSDASLIMEEAVVEPGAHLAGKTLAEARFRQHFESIVIAVIKPAAEDTRFNPGPGDRIEAGDVLIVLGSREMTKRLVADGCAAGGSVDVR